MSCEGRAKAFSDVQDLKKKISLNKLKKECLFHVTLLGKFLEHMLHQNNQVNQEKTKMSELGNRGD